MLVVHKYGGTSVGDLERIENVANRVIKAREAGQDIVVVVSAMSGETNKLISFAEHFTPTPAKKEMDMLLSSGERVTAALLSIALQAKGFDAVAMSGRQAGIVTDDVHTYARIESIDPSAMFAAIQEGKIVIVAGFQGINKDGSVTTLGRGGSDLSAVALAGALKADQCEIYSDVDGIYTTDPRIEPKAKKLDTISYDEMLELSSLGAKVLQNRSVELAKKLNIKLYAKSSFSDNEGTLITEESDNMEEVLVSGVVLDKNQARVTLRGVSDRPGIAAEIFTMLAQEHINVDMIIQNVGTDGTTNLGFTVPQSEHLNAKRVMESFDHDIQGMDVDGHVCKVSVVGVGMKSHSGVAATAFSALAKNGINIQMISTSEIKVSMVIDEQYGELAIRALHDAYELDK
ncbi:MAG TPA: aspartate kinase [Sulfurovum sp.]|nr:MAG: aspartate kinase [Sulfurovum sp. 35-42-20]OYY55674.1 MAG: aspartate kinase [Sulfurovum sp. 28-43-6]OYZ25331.1 MAG: aspartate kinase [Sulfurovum sp. 16-42-52]OYZ49081.1 MAG: aspartate kinase [Sulfurovum sp. 24-42-9]OZA46848.1 MAG: aspartate kinase [Sulfurovum sp. 17-42-90]OZA59191.1 MAG: aspartate kinase [Sulfurovum sp. 39-42-12]HQR74404.1 aspartate kinase [Sulfurovum sp.]